MPYPIACRYAISVFTAKALAWTVIPANHKDFDYTNGAVRFSPDWRFVAPVAGVYHVHICLLTEAYTWLTTDDCNIALYVNGEPGSRIMMRFGDGHEVDTPSKRMWLDGSGLVDLRSGDAMQLRMYASKTTDVVSYKTTAEILLKYNFVEIFKL